MMSSFKWWAMGLGALAATALGVGCSSSSSGSGTTSTSTTTSGTAGGGTTTAGTGGAGGGGTTTSGTGGGTTTTTTAAGTGGASNYTCNTCLNPTPGEGAKAKECKATGDACFQNKLCVSLFNCTYQGTVDGNGDPLGPCENSAAGACCTFDCYAHIKMIGGDVGGQEAIDLYEAVDQCTTCGICKDVCDGADIYCAKYAMGPGSCP